MGNFERDIPKHIKAIAVKINMINRAQLALIHDCDCEYCDWAGDVHDDDKVYYDELKAQIEEHKAMIEKLEQHAKIHNVEL